MLENKTIEQLLESLAMASIYTGMEIVQGNNDVVLDHGEEAVRFKQEILKRFKQLEEYKFMYEGLEK